MFRARLARLGVGGGPAERLLEEAGSDPGWRAFAALDTSLRAVEAIVRSGGLGAGEEAARVLERLFTRARDEASNVPPPAYWPVRPAPPGPEGERRLVLRGAVLLQVRGPRAAEGAAARAPLSPELVAALEEAPSRPGRELLRLLAADHLLAPSALLVAFAIAAAGVVFEAVLLRSLFDLGRELAIAGQRLGAMGVLLLFTTALLLLELSIASGLLRLGRHLEVRLRAAFLEKIPRLGDRYFARPVESDGHMLTAFRYIARNPVAAGLCEQPSDWIWGSYRGCAGYDRGFSFVTDTFILAIFHEDATRARRLLRAFVESE